MGLLLCQLLTPSPQWVPSAQPEICYGVPSDPTILVKWTDAYRGCMEFTPFSQLANLRSPGDTAAMTTLLADNNVGNGWIGLRQMDTSGANDEGWVWTDPRNTAGIDWYSGQPNNDGLNFQNQDCGHFYSAGGVADFECESRRITPICEIVGSCCPAGWTPSAFSTLKCYKAYSAPQLTWSDANAYCASEISGGRLAVGRRVEDLQSMVAIMENGNIDNAWIGLEQKLPAKEPRGGWRWIDPLFSQYLDINAYWFSQQPNNANGDQTCGHIFAGGPGLGDYQCSQQWSFICEGAPLIPCPAPTEAPTFAPSTSPIASPSPSPSVAPSLAPSPSPSAAPSPVPSTSPSSGPSHAPSPAPSLAPSLSPSAVPSEAPSFSPSGAPSAAPSPSPSAAPSPSPSAAPSPVPSPAPSQLPSSSPSPAPSLSPSMSPSDSPSPAPSPSPSNAPSPSPSFAPSRSPSVSPSPSPSVSPSDSPSPAPSPSPSAFPSTAPSLSPSNSPSPAPSPSPSSVPSQSPSPSPSQAPSPSPSLAPSVSPSVSPTQAPSPSPSAYPSLAPSPAPTGCICTGAYRLRNLNDGLPCVVENYGTSLFSRNSAQSDCQTRYGGTLLYYISAEEVSDILLRTGTSRWWVGGKSPTGSLGANTFCWDDSCTYPWNNAETPFKAGEPNQAGPACVYWEVSSQRFVDFSCTSTAANVFNYYCAAPLLCGAGF